MSRQLPARPSLEYLRKQAKELLGERRRANPSEHLADAQHALAQEYGFSSWPKLKTHVEAVSSLENPLAGYWKANLAQSKRHPANEFQSAAIVFEIEGDRVRVTDVVVDASGRQERHINTIRADGREYAAESGHGYCVVAKWRDPYTLETVGKKDGQVVGAATYQVSTDRRVLTISADQQSVVLDRVDAERLRT
jgi:hypothetical protein